MVALASEWLIHFRLLWNRWTEFNETWQEARSQHLLPSLGFLCRSVNKNGRSGRFLKKTAHCTQVHDMWPFGPLVVFNRGRCINFEPPKSNKHDQLTNNHKSRLIRFIQMWHITSTCICHFSNYYDVYDFKILYQKLRQAFAKSKKPIIFN